jgi:predicted  nucleic acid-binding Zn-ribbon protein
VLSVIESIGTKAGGNFKQAERNLNILKLTLTDMGAPQKAIDLVNNAIGKLGGSTNLTKKQAEALRKQFAAIFGTFKTNFQAGANEIDKVESKIRSLTDFVSDLRSVLQSAFEVRYGAQTGLDAITSAWFNLTQAAKDAEKAVKSANDEINQSMADKTVLQYQLSVAQRYKDEKRSAVIRAKLAKLDQQIVDQQQQLADANSANDKSLTGNTKSAIDNRAKVRDLVTQYNSYLLSLANTNMSSTDLAAKAKELEADFLAQGLALGYAETELKTYTQAFAGDFTKVLAGVPRDITVTVNTDPALRAIEEFVAKAQTELAKVGALPTASAPVGGSGFVASAGNLRPGPEKDGKFIGQIGPQGNWIWNGTKWIKRAMGGYVSGPGGPTSDSIPAMLSNGEYVINSRSVGSYGLDFMNALNQQKVSFAPTQGSFSSASSGGSQMVYLSPEDRALLRAAVDRPIALYTENSKIAQSANAGNVLLAQRGTN